MTDKHQVIFRDNLLSEFPVMKDFFKAIPCKERARALLSMSEAYAHMVDPNCKDINALYRASAAVWLGFRISGRDTINSGEPYFPTTVPNPTPVETEPETEIIEYDMDDFAAELNRALNPPEPK